ncbi:dehydrogenase/reductase SDR family member 7B-like [Gigantopelta aegis]|uniref:dehydrogenase/reductase SDR family member 7B-like n=1 Tax=Gigantopelta aegis TaxID=1735272 RepID=UPI001B888EEA|nr:dehydrogenase/reductase SDR family member 7B-like [Gigantopelta aegis]XP_041364882.1 dehydrogenase/reductase SDR family member 7B-like [Gigantopelta aegis]XP_041364883.1 dehydrogenase/reductase SDR family member 7B-like [Gigantopelta aegis]
MVGGSWILLAYVAGISLCFLCLVYMLSLFLEHWRRKTIKDKIVLITGATSGLGRACAEVFYKAGCHVILSGRSTSKLEETRTALQENAVGGGKHELHMVTMDLEDLASLQEKCQEAVSIFGEIDILINNAGVSFRGQIENTSLEVDQKVMLVNYFGHVALTKAILPTMRNQGRGHIVGISSIQGKISIPYRSAYSASKHAFQAFFDCLRAEVADRNIAVTVISPGYVKTNLSVNAVCEDGSKYGVTDKTTAAGMSPEYVAMQVLNSVIMGRKDVILASFVPRIAVFIRTLLPGLFFKLMASRAEKQKHDFMKNK